MQHLLELAGNSWVVTPLLLLLWGEYIPFSAPLWRSIGRIGKRAGSWFVNRYEPRLYPETDRSAEKSRITLKLNNFFARILFFLLSALVVILLELFWELGFKGISRSFERSGAALHARRWIEALPAWGVLLLFITPFILMELLGIVALGAFVSGHLWLGAGLYLAKVLLFIPVHFILHTGKRELLSIPWFERRYRIVTDTLDWFKTTQSYHKAAQLIQTVKAYIKAAKERFRQNITLLKKAFEHEDLLDPTCEAIRQKILTSDDETIREEKLYEKFFHCMEQHLQESAHHPTRTPKGDPDRKG